MAYGYSKDGGRGQRLRQVASGAGTVDAALLGAAVTAAVDDVPPRPGGVIDQFTDRVIEMQDAARAGGFPPCSSCRRRPMAPHGWGGRCLVCLGESDAT